MSSSIKHTPDHSLADILKPREREGSQAATPGFYSEISPVIRNAEAMERIIGQPTFDDLFAEAGKAIYGRELDSYTLYATLVFNSQDRAILTFYDTLDGPTKDNPNAAEPRSWRKKFPDDGGSKKAIAATIMGWTE